MNRVELIGNLGSDPDVLLVGETSQVATVSIATDESYKNDAGEWGEGSERKYRTVVNVQKIHKIEI